MAASSQGTPHLSGGGEQLFSTALYGLFAALCVVYAVMAFDYFISFAAGREGLWLRLFAAFVSPEHALGSGSAHVVQHDVYSETYRWMLMHTTMGAFAMALGPFQFIAAIRRRFPAAHRAMGKIYLVGVVLSMVAGIGYLGATQFDQVYSGPPFAIALLSLDIIVLYTAWLAYSAIRQRDVMRHQAWMAVNFALLFVTPLLRILWIAFGWLYPTMDQQSDNLAITTFLLPLSLFGALLWITLQRPRARASGAAELSK